MTGRRTLQIVAACFVALSMAVACTGGDSTLPETSSSTASSSVVVPNVVGLEASAAETALTNTGLSMDESVMTGIYLDAAVIRQRPRPGTPVEPGAIVHVVVGPASAAG
ncbi:MAG: PASTA domain-containing protein [Actinomycetota bacterium]